MSPAAGGDGAAARPARFSWPRAIGLALLIVYVPVLVPLVVGSLSDCAHCERTYLQFFPIVPGWFALWMTDSDGLSGVLAGAVSLGTLALAAWVLRLRRRAWRCGLGLLVSAWVTYAAFGFVAIVRA